MQDLFIELLQVAIGTRDSLSRAPSSIEWQTLYDECLRQAVDCVILGGIDYLPENQRPPKDLLLQWIGVGEMLRQRNGLLDKRCVELEALFANQFKSCILKGQGNALLYPEPYLRQCGDIDIWVEGKREKIIEFLRNNGRIGHIDIKHCDWEFFQDTPVEVHFIPTWFYNPFINKKLQRWIKGQAVAQFGIESEKGFNVPTTTFNLVYVLIHIYRHLFDEGVGIRQLMDYYFVLVDNRQEAMAVFDMLKMRRFVGATMCVMQEVFKLDGEYLLCRPNVQEGQFLLNEIMRAGNFGRYDERNKHHQSRWANGLQNVKRNLRFVWLYPQEVCWMPAWKLWHWCWRKKKGYL